MKLQRLVPPTAIIFFFIIIISTAALLLNAESTQPPYGCDSSNPSTSSHPFCNTTLPINKRVNDLLSRLTLDEKITQLVSSSPAIPRLGVPSYEWWNEALHGVANKVGRGIRFNGTITSATSFPQIILTAASFNESLWYRIGQAIGTEARAMYNAGQARGMTFWAPNINIFRDPRWGRGQETPGEDPLVAGKYSVSYVRGVQGDSFEGGKLELGGDRLQASACCKHFTAYDLEDWNNVTRFAFDARVTAQDLADTYQPPFKRCVQQGRASGIMCAFNKVNGVPSCADFNLLTKVARGQWGFNGYIASDCDSVATIYTAQNYTKTPEDAVVDVLRAGMDVNCGSYLQRYTKSAIGHKKLDASEVDRALHNLFSIRMRLGLFDGNPINQTYGQIGPDQVCSKEHQDLALQAAEDGIVLLKNRDKLLPLPKSKSNISLAVIGPNANASLALLGNYYGPPCKTITPLQALQSYVNHTDYHQGCDFVNCTRAAIDEAVAAAKAVDYVVLIMGLDQTQEREKLDRVNLSLPGKQQELISSVAEVSKNRVILVIISGGPVDISSAKDDNKIGSILWGGYPGEAGGIALAEIIFGDHNPGGRLPVTWYPQNFVKIPMTDMRMRSDPKTGYPGRTYRFYNGTTVYDFGYGLSYSNYTYEFASGVAQNKIYLNESTDNSSDSSRCRLVADLGQELCAKKKFSVNVGVTNQGEMAGKHPVLVFVGQKTGQKNPKNGSPMKQLVGFKSVKLSPGERAEVKFVLSPCKHFSHANEEGLIVVEEGSHFLLVGEAEYPFDIRV